jgi:hypothetical protein
MEVIGFIKMLVTTYNTAQHHDPDDHSPHFHHFGNLKAYNIDEQTFYRLLYCKRENLATIIVI